MTEIERLKDHDEKRKARIKAQNESAKERWETVSCRLPKGTKQFFVDRGYTLNGIINELIQREIERIANNEQHEARNAETDPAQIEPEKITQATAAPEKVPSLEELQEMLNAKREERAAVPEEIKRPEADEGEEPRAILAPAEPQSVTDAPGLSVRELAERAKTTVRDEEAKREAARQKSEAESAVAEMLKNRS